MENKAESERDTSHGENAEQSTGSPAGSPTGSFPAVNRPGSAPSGGDRRISRTRSALRTALLALIEEKGYETITVEEITSRANVGRATFYLHYKDKDDLLLEEFSEMASQRVQQVSGIPLTDWLPSEKQAIMPLRMVFQHVAENPALYRLVLRGESAQRVSDKFRQILTNSIDQVLHTRLETDPVEFSPEMPIGFIASYFSGALLNSVVWWLEQDMSIPSDEMALMFQRLFFPGAKKALGWKGKG